MKTYTIETPDVLERAAGITKWQGHKVKVLNHVALMHRLEKNPDPMSASVPVTLELGRQAQLFRHDGGKKRLLATLNLNGARQFVMEERLVGK